MVAFNLQARDEPRTCDQRATNILKPLLPPQFAFLLQVDEVYPERRPGGGELDW